MGGRDGDGDRTQMSLKMDIGDQIRKIRTAQDLSQDELAKRVGVAHKTIWRWERGQQELSTERLEQLAEGLNVDVGELLPPRETAKGEKVPQRNKDDADIRAVIGIWVAHMQVTLRDVADSVSVLRENVEVLQDILEGVRDHLTIVEDRFKIDDAPQIPEIEQLQEMFDSLRSRREKRRAAKMTPVDRTRDVAYGERPHPADDQADKTGTD